MGLSELRRMIIIFVTFSLNKKKKSHKDSEAKNIQINYHWKVKELLQWRITRLNVNIMTKYECVSCLVIAIIVAFVVVIHLQCLVSVYLSLVKIKYSVCVWKKKILCLGIGEITWKVLQMQISGPTSRIPIELVCLGAPKPAFLQVPGWSWCKWSCFIKTSLLSPETISAELGTVAGIYIKTVGAAGPVGKVHVNKIHHKFKVADAGWRAHEGSY